MAAWETYFIFCWFGAIPGIAQWLLLVLFLEVLWLVLGDLEILGVEHSASCMQSLHSSQSYLYGSHLISE